MVKTMDLLSFRVYGTSQTFFYFLDNLIGRLNQPDELTGRRKKIKIHEIDKDKFILVEIKELNHLRKVMEEPIGYIKYAQEPDSSRPILKIEIGHSEISPSDDIIPFLYNIAVQISKRLELVDPASFPQPPLADFWERSEEENIDQITPTVEVVEEERDLKTEKQQNPWDVIDNHKWDQDALRMWWDGSTNKTIGKAVSVAPRTVTNQLCILRKKYGEEIVPTDDQRKERISKP